MAYNGKGIPADELDARLAALVAEWDDRPPTAAWLAEHLGAPDSLGLGNRARRRFVAMLEGRAPAVPRTPPVPHLPPTQRHVQRQHERAALPEAAGDRVARSLTVNGARISTLDDLLDAADVDREAWSVRAWRANTYEAQAKNEAGEVVVTTLWQVRADLERRIAPVPVSSLQPPMPRRAGPPPGPIEKTLILPDSQHGFRWADRYQRLVPMHDRVAIDCALQLAKVLQPDTIVLLGDMLDLAPWSTKFANGPDVHGTTDPSLAELAWQIAELRRVCPSARIVYMEGNHESRAVRAIRERMPEAEQVMPTIPQMLGLDRWDVEYRGPYGAREWLYDDVRVIHGDAHGKSSATRHMEQAAVTTVYGHVHRVELVPRRYETPTGSRVAYSISPGCLCRVDGAVPGVAARPDWHQGLCVLSRETSTGALGAHVYNIEAGRLVMPHTVIVGRDRSEEIAVATGWAQIAAGAVAA